MIFFEIDICPPVLYRSNTNNTNDYNSASCCCSSGVEHFLGKEEVMGSNPINSSEVQSVKWLLFCFI